MDVIKLFLIGFIVSISLLIPVSQAASSRQSEFNQVYDSYQKSFAEQDYQQAARFAKQALDIAAELYGREHKTTAILTFNYAQVYFFEQVKRPAEERDLEQVAKLFRANISLQEDIYGESSLELIDPLMYLGMLYVRYERQHGKGSGYYNRALKIARKHEQAPALLYADLSLEAGKELIQNSSSIQKSRRYLKQAYEGYIKLLPENDIRVVDSTFWYGKYNFLDKKYSYAEPLFLEVLDAYEEAGRQAHKQSLTTNAFMVELYESRGESDKASAHCRAIGKAKPWSGEQEQTPVYLLEPKWPLHALQTGKGGYVRVAFTVDTEGFVKDPEVVEADGHKGLPKAALAAIKKWRFAPKYVDGKAVDARTAYTMQFVLE